MERRKVRETGGERGRQGKNASVNGGGKSYYPDKIPAKNVQAFSVFVGNLSPRISRVSLWELFNIYRRVVGVFVPWRRHLRNNEYSFAFIRFREVQGMQEAIVKGNYRIIDGRTIRVSEARPRRSERKMSKQLIKHALKGKKAIAGSMMKERDSRTFKEVLMSEKLASEDKTKEEYTTGSDLNEKCVDELSKGDSRKGRDGQKDVQAGNIVDDKGATFRGQRVGTIPSIIRLKSIVPDDQEEWLNRSAVGTLRSFIPLRHVQESLAVVGILVQARPLGGLHVLLTFGDREIMECLLQDYLDMFETWFDSVIPWVEFNAAPNREFIVWVKLMEMPLQLWHEDIFKEIANSWGRYIAMGHSTKEKLDLEAASILVGVKSKTLIPSTFTVEYNRKSHNLKAVICYPTDFLNHKEEARKDQEKEENELSETSSFSQEGIDGSENFEPLNTEPTALVGALNAWSVREDVELQFKNKGKDFRGTGGVGLYEQELRCSAHNQHQPITSGSSEESKTLRPYDYSSLNGPTSSLGSKGWTSYSSPSGKPSNSEVPNTIPKSPNQMLDVEAFSKTKAHSDSDGYGGCPLPLAMAFPEKYNARSRGARKRRRKLVRAVLDKTWQPEISSSQLSVSDGGIRNRNRLHNSEAHNSEAEQTYEVGKTLGIEFECSK